jgi:hypothetical protein
LKEIGYAASFEELDDFTVNCFLVVSETFAKCRSDEMKKEKQKRAIRK